LVLGLASEIHTAAGHPRQVLALLDGALVLGDKNSEHFYTAELHRLQGEVLLAEGQAPAADGADAEACLRQAIEVAQRQQAKSFELRAATSLARLWRDQGKRTEARDLLAPIYEWFTEGFDTRDLVEAKALLEELQ